MNINIPPSIIAAGIAGSGIGTATGIMTKGEALENRGASDLQQLTGSMGAGISNGLVGAGIGIGVSGTVVALRKILGK